MPTGGNFTAFRIARIRFSSPPMKLVFFGLIALLLSPGRSGAEVMVVAHRGASAEAPENTLPAFHLAWQQGADAIEGDFHLTRDGKVVCLHDANTGKVADRKLEVAQSTLAELRTLDVGRWKGERFRDTLIPTLAEVLATVPKGKKLYLEVKCGPEIVPALLRDLKKGKLKKEQVVFISFDASVIRALKQRAPAHKAFWLCSVKKEGSGKSKPTLAKALTTLREIGADGLSSGKDGIAAPFIAGVIAAGFEYHVWTVNEVPTARRFAELGARSITSDVPAVIKQGLGAK